jgi:hypothetical protein
VGPDVIGEALLVKEECGWVGGLNIIMKKGYMGNFRVGINGKMRRRRDDRANGKRDEGQSRKEKRIEKEQERRMRVSKSGIFLLVT